MVQRALIQRLSTFQPGDDYVATGMTGKPFDIAKSQIAFARSRPSLLT